MQHSGCAIALALGTRGAPAKIGVSALSVFRFRFLLFQAEKLPKNYMSTFSTWYHGAVTVSHGHADFVLRMRLSLDCSCAAVATQAGSHNDFTVESSHHGTRRQRLAAGLLGAGRPCRPKPLTPQSQLFKFAPEPPGTRRPRYRSLKN
jgi:hypothetical protein